MINQDQQRLTKINQYQQRSTAQDVDNDKYDDDDYCDNYDYDDDEDDDDYDHDDDHKDNSIDNEDHHHLVGEICCLFCLFCNNNN